jgi:hypothetical protein
MRRLLSLLLSNAMIVTIAQGICAGQKWWSGAGSNCRPSAFREQRSYALNWQDAARYADLGTYRA